MDRIRLGPEETLCFISHQRGDAKGEARTLHTELSKCLNIDKKLVFIDVDALQDLDQLLRKHVGMTRVLVLLQTRDVLFRPFVLAEIYTALLDGIGILTVNIANGGYDFSKASNLLGAKDFPQRLEMANPGAVGALERQGIDVAQMGSFLNDKIPNLVSLPFDMTWPPEIRDAGVKLIGTRVVEMAQKVPPRILKPAPVSEAERLSAMAKKLTERGIGSEDAAQYAPRLVREGFTAENLVALARPNLLKKAGITKSVHVRAILSEDQIKEMEAKEEANLIAEERRKLERTKMELNFAQKQIEASKAAADASINAATEEERRALIAKAEQIRKEAQEKAKREAEEKLKREEEESAKRKAVERVEVQTTSPTLIKDAVLKRTIEAHSFGVNSVCFDPSGRILASGSHDKTMKLWGFTSGTEIRPLIRVKEIPPSGLSKMFTSTKTMYCTSDSDYVNSVCFDPSGQILASGSEDRTIKLWDVSSGKEMKTLTGHSKWVWSVCFHPSGQILASGSGDSTIKLWDVTSGKEIKTLKGHSYGVRSVCFHPSGRILASGALDETIKLWDVTSGNEIKTLEGHSSYVYSVCFDPSGQILASGSSDTTIKLWDITSGEEIKTLFGHSNWVWSVCFDPSGQILASGSQDSTIKLWHVTSGKEIKTLLSHSSSVSSVCFHPSGKILASGSYDNTIKLWDIIA